MGTQGTESEVCVTIEPHAEEMVSLIFADNPSEAGACRAVLEAHGVPTMIGDYVSGAEVHRNCALGVPILVPEGMRDQAEDILVDEACRETDRYRMSRDDDCDGGDEDDDDDGLDDDDEDDFDEDDFDDDGDDLDELAEEEDEDEDEESA